jgi:nondiscriminating glutamyl-tRNA synthetase
MSEIRVRIAPSPSGYLHVGTARTAIYNWLFARHNRGEFILRIEDTDIARSSQEMVDIILEGLQWLGLDWDEGPYYQSQRAELYQKYIEKIISDKKGYYCYCSPESLKQKREQAIAQKIAWKYDRTCLKLSQEEKEKLDEQGVPKAVRLFIPEGATEFSDLVYGELKREHKDIDDLVIMRSDGRPTYNFACVADDLDMRISHVIRGNDHISNTFKQILIYQALEENPPIFAHLPLGLGEDRAKISKRKGAVSVTDYKENGFLPEAIFNFLALLGWSPKSEKEILTQQELIELFKLEDVNPSNPVFDVHKLEWMNGEYIRALPDEKLVELVIPFLLKENLITEEDGKTKKELLVKIVSLLKERCKKLAEFAENGKYFFKFDYQYDPSSAKKQFSSLEVAERLQAVVNELSILDDFKKEKIEEKVRILSDHLSLKPALLIHPLRLAVSGISMGPGLFEILEVLGKEQTIERLDRAIQFIQPR